MRYRPPATTEIELLSQPERFHEGGAVSRTARSIELPAVLFHWHTDDRAEMLSEKGVRPERVLIQQSREIFDAGTDRLGVAPASMKAGELTASVTTPTTAVSSQTMTEARHCVGFQ